MTSFNLFISNFHFVRPYWLLALLALFLVLWLLKKHRFYQSPWQQFLPSHLSQVLVEGSTNTGTNTSTFNNHTFLLKPFIIGLLSIIALAGPVWKKLPQPVYQTERGSVLIMDMSYSMYATDIKPNRLTRARFKAIDLLDKINEGDTGLIAYASDAFIISPLTQDIQNIALLLPSLTPEIMPTPGANPLAALTLAHDMLINAGHLEGDIYWFTDDVDNEEIADLYNWSNKFGHQLNILGVGTENGAPITLPSGTLLKDNTGSIVVPRLPIQKLKSLASRGRGHYQTIKNDDSDIDNLLFKDNISAQNKSKKQKSQQTGDQWQEQGAWLLLLVLPLMLSYFRRGSSILVLPLSCIPLLFLCSFSLVSPTSFATNITTTEAEKNVEENSPTHSPATTNTPASLWQNLWRTSDQQAQKQYNQENYQNAAKQFKNTQWQGSAHYKAGNYQEALDAFKQGKAANSAESLYNQGNALAQLQKYEQAIESYENALEKNADFQDAKENIKKIKALQQQQEQEQQGDQSESGDSQDDQSQGEKSQDEQNQEQQNEDGQQPQNEQNESNQESQDPSDNNQNSDQKTDQKQENKSEDLNEEQQEQQSKKEQSEKNSQNENNEENNESEPKTAAQIAAEQQAKETNQKHQQLLNKVTDDPYLLLRNKMQLEYQKRKQNGATRGVQKQW